VDESTGVAADSSPSPHIHIQPRETAAARRWRTAGYTFGVFSCLLFMVMGTVFGHFFWGSSTMRGIFSDHGLSTVFNTLTGDPLRDWQVDRQFPGRTSLNLLVLGVDHDYDNKMQIVKGTWGRSDSILLARVDLVGKKIDAVTIPRDTAVRIPGYRGVHKINAAHSYGGPDKTIETIEATFGVRADAYVTINFEGFQKLVDAIGGIDVNVEKRLKYDDNWGNLHIDLYPGPQHLNGYQAMGYVRIRKSDNDEMRSRRQHEFLEAVRTKIKQPSTFGRLPGAIDELANNLNRGNLTMDQMFALMNFARTLPRENISLQTLPSFEGPSFVTVDNRKAAELLQRVFFPNQMIALNIDTPDPNGVREGRPKHKGDKKDRKPAQKPAGAVELSVEEPAKPDQGNGSSPTPSEPPTSPTDPKPDAPTPGNAG
jgi:LCP family protein required for cell wall assembly